MIKETFEKIRGFFENKWTPFFFIFLFCLTSLVFLLQRPIPAGVDSYDYLSYIFKMENSIQGKNWFVHFVFGLFPQSFLFWNFISVLFLFIASVTVSKIGELLNPKYGAWAGIGIWLTFFFQFVFFNFEPTTIGFTFGLISTYFFLKNNAKINLLSGFLFLVGLSIWYGTAFFLLPMSLLDKRLLPVSIVFLLFYNEAVWSAIKPIFSVTERTPILGLMYIFFYFFNWVVFHTFRPSDWFNVRKWFDFKINSLMLPFMVVFGIMIFFSSKFIFLGIPFASLNLFSKTQNYKGIFMLLILTCLLVFVLSPFVINAMFPNQNQVSVSKKAIELNPMVQNDFGFGHWIVFFGGEPSRRWGEGESEVLQRGWFVCDQRPILTVFDLNSEFRKAYVYGEYNIYQCNNSAAFK